MGRQRQVESTAGYFRKVFEDNPQWITQKSNAEVIARYNADHPGKPADGRIKANLSNVKSTLRRDLRSGKLKKRKAGNNAAAAPTAEAVNNGLESLELAIDDCFLMARNLDSRRLGKVIDHLRAARNHVVWMLGEH